MGGGFFSVTTWVRPFGFLRDEWENESELDDGLDGNPFGLLATYVVVLVLDLVTLPLAVLWLAGVGRSERSRCEND